MPLTNEQIATLIAGSRTRNAYAPKVQEFVASDDAAINPQEAWPLDFAGKSATALYQSFNNAVKKLDLAATVQILQRDGNVFLLHRERAHVIAAAVAANANTNGNKPATRK